MPNTSIPNHPLEGTSHIYRAKQATPTSMLGPYGSDLVVAPGMNVTILAVFTNWNDVAGLDMLYITVHETGYGTHVTPRDLGLDRPLVSAEPSVRTMSPAERALSGACDEADEVMSTLTDVRRAEPGLWHAHVLDILAQRGWALTQHTDSEPEREWQPMTLGQIKAYLAGHFGIGDYGTVLGNTDQPHDWEIGEIRETEHGVEYR